MITGGHGPGSQIGGSGMMIPSANAEVGNSNVKDKITNIPAVDKIDFVFILSS
jgi:hypothetical protein